MDIEITKMNGDGFRLSDYGMHVRDFIVSAPEIESHYEYVDGRNGNIDMGAVFTNRSIVVPFYFKGADYQDVALARDELFSLVVDSEPFYVRELRRIKYHPGHIFEECDDGSYDNMYAGGKRYKVRMASAFDIEQLFTYGMGEIPFETTELPYAESIGTTADIDRDGLNYGDGWSYGMGLLYDDESHIYTHTESNFRIYNAGNVPVHPFEQDLVIRIISLKNTSEPYELRNVTNGSVFRINGGLSMGQTVELDGPNITSNGAQFLRETNRGFIELDSGWNEFEVSGSGISVISFDFRFYYF